MTKLYQFGVQKFVLDKDQKKRKMLYIDITGYYFLQGGEF